MSKWSWCVVLTSQPLGRTPTAGQEGFYIKVNKLQSNASPRPWERMSSECAKPLFTPEIASKGFKWLPKKHVSASQLPGSWSSHTPQQTDQWPGTNYPKRWFYTLTPRLDGETPWGNLGTAGANNAHWETRPVRASPLLATFHRHHLKSRTCDPYHACFNQSYFSSLIIVDHAGCRRRRRRYHGGTSSHAPSRDAAAGCNAHVAKQYFWTGHLPSSRRSFGIQSRCKISVWANEWRPTDEQHDGKQTCFRNVHWRGGGCRAVWKRGEQSEQPGEAQEWRRDEHNHLWELWPAVQRWHVGQAASAHFGMSDASSILLWGLPGGS